MDKLMNVQSAATTRTTTTTTTIRDVGFNDETIFRCRTPGVRQPQNLLICLAQAAIMQLVKRGEKHGPLRGQKGGLMTLLAVGSIALDSVETPHGVVDDVLGGSATYFSYAASFFAPVRLVGVVGKDFPPQHRDLLASRDIDLSGLEVADGRTFRWRGSYEGAMNAATTLDVQLNVLGDFEPKVPEAFRDSKFVFLANTSPRLQKRVLDQVDAPELVVCDTMNLYIETERDALVELLGQVDGMVINDAEAVQLTGEHNLVAAGRQILALGPRFVAIKKGEHGSMLVSGDSLFCIPAYPLERVVDPTGAGDSFAGGMMGCLAAGGKTDGAALRRALAFGTILASFDVEGFSLTRFQAIGRADIYERFHSFAEMMRF
jgi:sugar/nucleoside kinase (ribokinase family)